MGRAIGFLLALSGLFACAGRAEPKTHAPLPLAQAAGSPAIDVSPAPADAAIDALPLSETVARALLSRRFRALGLRVRYDVRVREAGLDLTVDGFDPERGIGFEYVAPEERDTDLSAEEREVLTRHASVRVLVIDAGGERAVAVRAEQFLETLSLTADAQPSP